MNHAMRREYRLLLPPRLTAIAGRPDFRIGRADRPVLRVGKLYAGDVASEHNAVGGRQHARPMLTTIHRVIQHAAGTAGPYVEASGSYRAKHRICNSLCP